VGLRRHQLGQLFAEGLIMDLERMEQDGIDGGRRNGSCVRDRYAATLYEDDKKEANQARPER